MINLDLKDRKILYQLDLNCRQSNAQIGKKVGLSRKVVDYRIKRMEESGIISGYWTAINTLKLGYYAFRIYINFLDVTKEIINEIIQYFKKYKNVWAILSIKGPIDLDVVLFVNDVYEFNLFWENTLEKYGVYFSENSVSILTQVTCYKKSYLLLDDKIEKERKFYTINCEGKPTIIDKVDYEILDIIALNAKIPLLELAKKIGVSSQSINYRIRNLIKKDVIKAFRTSINLSKIGLMNCSIDIYLRDQSKKKNILEYLITNPYFELSMDMTIGWADLSLEFMVANSNKLTEIMDDIDTKFPGIIRKTDFYISKTIHKERWLPKMTF
jgi:DNA-binding Lrp family transcriptional regulator